MKHKELDFMYRPNYYKYSISLWKLKVNFNLHKRAFLLHNKLLTSMESTNSTHKSVDIKHLAPRFLVPFSIRFSSVPIWEPRANCIVPVPKNMESRIEPKTTEIWNWTNFYGWFSIQSVLTSEPWSPLNTMIWPLKKEKCVDLIADKAAANFPYTISAKGKQASKSKRYHLYFALA